MKIKDIDLDFEDIGRWPIALKVIAIFAVCFFSSGLLYSFFISSQIKFLEEEEDKESVHKKTFSVKKIEGIRLNAYSHQAGLLEQKLRGEYSQLSSKEGMSDLLTEITRLGTSSGLEVEYYNPQKEYSLRFYTELPIRIKVIGSYHDLGGFVSSLANMPRIVIVDEFSIKRLGGLKAEDLVMEATLKTYRYHSEEKLKLTDDEDQEF